jgi:hypothetical protein
MSGIAPICFRASGVPHIVGKDLDKGYKFTLDLILIEGLHTKLWASKVATIPTLGISGLPFGNLGTK